MVPGAGLEPDGKKPISFKVLRCLGFTFYPLDSICLSKPQKDPKKDPNFRVCFSLFF